MRKVFIIGLPRTGTTSVCAALLDLGFKVAHNAYKEDSIIEADVIADTPAFCDYRELDKTFPDSKFIYLDRHLEQWLPSIKFLLTRMYPNLARQDEGGFPPLVKRCYQKIFHPLNRDNIRDEKHLRACYGSHKMDVLDYFGERKDSFRLINLSAADSYAETAAFLGISGVKGDFPRLNTNDQFTAWGKIQHVNKIHTSVL